MNKLIDNLKQCPRFNSCSRNLCPLDLELSQRTGKRDAKCRYMREPKQASFHGLSFTSGGTLMPDVLLNFVPEGNVGSLNQVSQERWNIIHKK